MSWDFNETMAKEAIANEAKLKYDPPAGKPKRPVGDAPGFRETLAQNLPACWFALQCEAQGRYGRRKKEIEFAAQFVRDGWYPKASVVTLGSDLKSLLATIARPQPPLKYLPLGTWWLDCRLKLTKDFFSKDELAFAMTENPIRRSRAFRELTIAASGWKGALRSAFRAVHPDAMVEQIRLFGPAEQAAGEQMSEDSDEDGGVRGRLVFCPVYIPPATDTSRLRVINPHSRKEKVGRSPIFYEVIKQGVEAPFQLLYLPWNWSGRTRTEQVDQVAADLDALGPPLLTMFRDLGVGGKTTSGFGTFQVLSGELAIGEDTYQFASAEHLPTALSKAAKALREQVNHAG